MASLKHKLLKSHYYNYNAEFRRIRRDKGKKRGKRSMLRRLTGKIIGSYGDEIALGAGVAVVGRLLKGRRSVGTATISPETPQDKIKVGLQYLSEGASLGQSPAVDSIANRLNLIGQRVQRGINTYQDIKRLPVKRRTKLLAGLGITGQVGQDIWRDLNKSITLGKRK